MDQETQKEQRSGKTTEVELNEILDELGISFSEDFILILHNDNINGMEDVIVALFEVCRLSNERCVSVMMEAHNNGKSVIMTGEINKLLDMKFGLYKRGLSISIEISQ